MEKVLATIDKIGSMMGYDKCGFRLTFPREQAAKEIHEHFMKFVEWKDAHCDPVEAIDFKGYYHVDWLFYPNNEAITLDEVYQYYCDKILQK